MTKKQQIEIEGHELTIPNVAKVFYPENGFTNVPVSVYWAISTMTTVGYGDITPQTGLGRFIASMMMLIVYNEQLVILNTESWNLLNQSIFLFSTLLRLLLHRRHRRWTIISSLRTAGGW